MWKNFILMTALLLLTSSAAAIKDIVTLTIINQSDEIICVVGIIPSGTDDQSITGDMVHSTVIRPDEQVEYEIESGFYSVGLLDCNRKLLKLWDYRELSQSTTLTYPDPTQEPFEKGIELNNLGMQAVSEGRYDNALEYFKQVLVIVRETGDRIGEGVILSNIGTVYYSQGQYAQALDFLQQALVINREVGDRASEGTTLNNIGLVYFGQGQYVQAMDFHQQALVINREVGDRAGEGTTLNNIGEVYRSQGQYAQALDFLQQALVIMREVHDRIGEGATLSNIGAVYYSQGQYIQAMDFYQQSLVISREVGDRAGEGTTLNNIGEVYRSQGEYVRALDIYQQVLMIMRDIGNREGEGTTLNNIGGTYYRQGQYAQALTIYQQALVIVHELGDRAGEAEMFNNMGVAYYRQGQYAQALDAFQQALIIIREVGDRAGEENALGNIGFTYEFGLSDSAQAVDYYRLAVELQESLLQTTALNQAIISLSSQTSSINLYARLTTLLIQADDLALALEYAERGRSILSRDELRNQPVDFRANQQDQTLLQDEEMLRLAVLDAQNLVDTLNKNLNATNQAKQDAQAALEDAQDVYNRHLERMQLQGGFLSRQLALDVAPFEDIQAALPEESALLMYGVSGFGSYALLITADDLQGFTLYVTDDQINEAVKTFATDREANASVLSDLYQLVFAPIADNIPADTKHLIISADGALNYVPFAALQAPDGHYLIDDYAISMIPSGTAFALLKARQNAHATQPILSLAQPSAAGLPRLANARTEALDIASLFGAEADIDATEADLRDNVAGSSILHISAHAELNPFAPLYSVIHLATDTEGQYDGRLEVREIYELDLSATELVILSGCETGSGGDGEDFGMINRAFFGAGAQKVVSSLWSVDDEATADLLTAFMEARLSGTYTNDADALQVAMIKVKETYPDPYYWASFVLTGLAE